MNYDGTVDTTDIWEFWDLSTRDCYGWVDPTYITATGRNQAIERYATDVQLPVGSYTRAMREPIGGALSIVTFDVEEPTARITTIIERRASV